MLSYFNVQNNRTEDYLSKNLSSLDNVSLKSEEFVINKRLAKEIILYDFYLFYYISLVLTQLFVGAVIKYYLNF